MTEDSLEMTSRGFFESSRGMIPEKVSDRVGEVGNVDPDVDKLEPIEVSDQARTALRISQ